MGSLAKQSTKKHTWLNIVDIIGYCNAVIAVTDTEWIKFSYLFIPTNTGVPGSIPGAARFFWAAVGLERGPLRLVNNLRSYLEEIVAAPGLENRS
jgi:hypothetical protein